MSRRLARAVAPWLAAVTPCLAGCHQTRPLTSVQFSCDDAGARDHATLTCPARGGPAWRELGSKHFLLRTDLPGDCARAALLEYEQTYAALREVAFPFDVDPPDRVTLVIFARNRDEDAISQGTLRSGWFKRGDTPWEEPSLAVLGSARIGSLRVTFAHELTHHFVRFYYGPVPTWVNEGLADFYETLDVHDGWATLGIPSTRRSFDPTRWELRVPSSKAQREDDMRGAHRFTLYATTLPSVRELDRMTPEMFYASRASTESERAETTQRNYIGAWAVVHYLRTGPETVRKQFDGYLTRLAEGSSHRAAWDEAFAGAPDKEIDRAVRAAMDEEETPGIRTAYEHPPPPPISERVMSDAEVHLAWIKVRAGSERQEHIGLDALDVDEALTRDPKNVEAIFARARVHLEAGRVAEAEVDVRRAMELRPDELRYVEGLATVVYEVDVARASQPKWDRMEPLLAKLSAPSASSRALNRVGWFAAVRNRPDDGFEASKRSVQKDPACWACYDTLAALLYQKGDVEAALGAQRLAANLVPEGREVRSVTRRLVQFEAAVAAKRAARGDPSWKPPPLELRARE